MKKQIILVSLAMFLTITTLMAQGFQQKSVEERTKETLEKIQTPLTLSAEQTTKATATFTEFYTAQQKAMEVMRNSGSMDRDKMKEMRDKLSAERDEKLQAIFTADQFKKWKDDIAPSMQPQRRPNN